MEIKNIAKEITETKENIILIYAFNATGKTRLSVEFKNLTKTDDKHSGVYYNAFSEDLFVWNNDNENNEENIRIEVKWSNLNRFHSLFTEEDVFKKLMPYKPKYDFEFVLNDDREKGIEYIIFYCAETHQDQERKPIKISRAEERIFVWCFFLVMFEVEGWADQQSSHFFIDDPVSSLDDNNIFITAFTIYDLIEKYHKNRKFVITTHHFGFFSILGNWLTKGEKASKTKKMFKAFIISNKNGSPTLEGQKNDVYLFHLYLMQLLKKAKLEGIKRFHFAMLRQLLENIASFLGAGYIGYVLDQLQLKNSNVAANILNALSHQNVYQNQSENLSESEQEFFREVLEEIEKKYKFKLHER